MFEIVHTGVAEVSSVVGCDAVSLWGVVPDVSSRFLVHSSSCLSTLLGLLEPNDENKNTGNHLSNDTTSHLTRL
jgi:hypothetical protein